MGNLGKRSGTTAASINRIQHMEERISGVEDTIEEMDSAKKIPKYPGNMGHNEKTKPKNNTYKRRRKFNSKAQKIYLIKS